MGISEGLRSILRKLITSKMKKRKLSPKSFQMIMKKMKKMCLLKNRILPQIMDTTTTIMEVAIT